MKKGKEIKLNSYQNYNVVYGSVNNKNPTALYINVSAWAEPNTDSELNYTRIIKDIDKSIRQSIFNLLDYKKNCPFLPHRTIIDFDIRKSGVRFGKRSFTSCEVTLYLKDAIPVNSEYITPYILEIIETIIEKSFKPNKYFKFYKKKKKLELVKN